MKKFKKKSRFLVMLIMWIGLASFMVFEFTAKQIEAKEERKLLTKESNFLKKYNREKINENEMGIYRYELYPNDKTINVSEFEEPKGISVSFITKPESQSNKYKIATKAVFSHGLRRFERDLNDYFNYLMDEVSFKPEDFLDLKIEICSCELFNLNDKSQIEGYYAYYDNRIVIMASPNWLETLNHEIGHFLHAKKIPDEALEEVFNSFNDKVNFPRELSYNFLENGELDADFNWDLKHNEIIAEILKGVAIDFRYFQDESFYSSILTESLSNRDKMKIKNLAKKYAHHTKSY